MCLFGFSTDTYDVLGRVMETGEVGNIKPRDIKKALNEFRGTVPQEYPPFSSKTVEGRPLFEWARGNVLSRNRAPAAQRDRLPHRA
jgi:tRNA pseudouridine55 synthase